MHKLKLISTAMVILGFILFIGGILMTMKELMELGLSVGIAGIIGFAIMFIKGSTSTVEPKSTSD